MFLDLEKLAQLAKFIVTAANVILIFVILIMLFIFAWYGIDFPTAVKEALLIVLGVLLGTYKETCGYWLGSSHGSDRKTEIMGKPPGGA